MRKSVQLFLFVLLFVFTSEIKSQGVFTSTATGDWSDNTKWNLDSGTDADGIPDSDDNVTIAATHTMTLISNATCNNLTLLDAGVGTRLVLGDFILDMNGTIQGDLQNLSTTLITSGSGKLRFIGNSRILFGANWGATTTGFNLDIALNSGQTGSTSTSVKAKSITITSGTFLVQNLASSIAGEVRPDEGVANTGTITIESGATLSCLRISRTSAPGTRFGSLVMNGSAKLILNSTTASSTNYLPAVSGGFPTYTFSPASVVEYTGSSSGTISVVPYHNLSIKLNN
nr:hypothetical protein [Chitinophagaceae bacterium]